MDVVVLVVSRFKSFDFGPEWTKVKKQIPKKIVILEAISNPDYTNDLEIFCGR